MHIIFGLCLDGPSHPPSPGGKDTVVGEVCCGPRGLLRLLELRLGLTGTWAPYPYRVEAYRRRLLISDCERRRFYHESLQVCSLAVAEALLCWRDDLIVGGWDFLPTKGAPARLQDLAAVENLPPDSAPSVPYGIAERLSTVLAALPNPNIGIAKMTLIDKRPLPPPWERLLQQLAQGGISIEEPAEPEKKAQGDLGELQGALLRGGNAEASGDGSLVIIRADSDIQAAEMIASWLTSDGAPKPVLLIPNGDRSLAGALAQCGASTLGIKSHSPSRPVLQILPMLLDLLWEPLDPYRLIEFLTLPETPIPKWVARQLAEVVAVAPGIGGTPWNKKVADIETAWAKKSGRSDLMLRLLLTLWLDTPRFRQSTGIPRHALLSLAERIITWAHTGWNNDDRASEMQILAGHAEQFYRIIESSPEERFSQPHLLQLVRMTQKVIPATGEGAEAGHLPWVEVPDAIVGEAKEILWWDFTSANIPDLRRSPWSKEEVRFLTQKNVDILEAENEVARVANSFTKPAFNAQERLVLVMPRCQDGADVAPHPFYDRAKIIFGNSLHKIELNANDWSMGSRLLPPLSTCPLPLRICPVPQRFWWIEGAKLVPRQVESYSSLNELFYRPFKWVIKYKAEIDKASLQGISSTRTVMGTLAHRFFQEIFRPGQDLSKWKRDDVVRMTEETLAPLIAKEGCLLLLPGFEALLASFVSKMEAAAWSMVGHIRDNGWRVGGTECVADGMLGNQPITGRIDLLLDGCRKSRAVVDLKWSGGKYRREELSENKALQLALYAHMLGDSGALPHVAFFILSDAELIAPDGLGFINARVVTAPEGNSLASLIKQMELTWHWRWSQLERGLIEVPVDGTLPDPEFPVWTGALVMPEDPCDPGDLLALVGWKEERRG